GSKRDWSSDVCSSDLGARRAPELARDDHRDVAGEVAEARVGRRLDRERRKGGERERAVGHRSAQRLSEQPLKVTLHPASRGAKEDRKSVVEGKRVDIG